MTALGPATVLRGDARALPLPDASVDLIVTSPPYWNQRAYEDGGEVYEEQIGDETDPREYLAKLGQCTREWLRVLKPTGSLFVNLGDKYSDRANGGPSVAETSRADRAAVRPAQANSTGLAPAKSLLGLPWRYALHCIDELGLTLRRDQIWHKTSAMPESVEDRTATRHEYLFHFTTQERYFSAIDSIREPSNPDHHRNVIPATTHAPGQPPMMMNRAKRHPLGRLPGSVWDIASEPLVPPAHLGLKHFAAFPKELPRRVILGWSPTGICLDCGEGRRPSVAVGEPSGLRPSDVPTRRIPGEGRNPLVRHGEPGSTLRQVRARAVNGETCGCLKSTAPTRPSVVLDPFGGTGTTALVARSLGRHGITVDRSADYCRLAQWRTTDPGQLAKALQLPPPPVQVDNQGFLFDHAELIGGAR